MVSKPCSSERLRAEVFVELLDAGHSAHRELALAIAADVLPVLDVELIVNVADDLLDDVLDGDEPALTPPYSSTTIAM